jgi:MFS family permease
VIEDVSISKDEKTMIHDIDSKLLEVNEENQFSDTNLVRNTMENISNKEKSSFSYIKRCFWILFCILFTIRLCNESLVVICPYYLIHHFQENTLFVSIFMFVGLLTIFPTSVIFKKVTLKYTRERKILIYLLFICFFGCFFIVDFFYDSIYVYSVFFVILVIVTSVIESLASSLLAKIIPPDWELGTFNAGFIITISTTVGRTIGSFMLTISGAISEDLILEITYSFCALLFLVIIIFFLINYSELRVKAIARILKNKSFKKTRKM